MATTRITYTDGTSETVPITMRATCKAEAHAIDVGWGPITQSPVRSGAYAAYAALRMAGRNLPDFEHWLDTVASFDLAAAKEEPEREPYGLAAWPQDSLGRLSFLLANRSAARHGSGGTRPTNWIGAPDWPNCSRKPNHGRSETWRTARS